MSGQTKKCSVFEKREIAEQYIREMNPYESRPSIAIDLVALTRYAKANNINLTELKESEIAMFQRKDQL